MVEYYIDVEDVLSDYLRTNMTDPKARAEATSSNTFAATALQTVFSITPPSGSVSCVTSVTVNGTDKTKWTDYYWDYQTQQITFYDGITLDQEVIINFKYGSTNWIYSDRPDDSLGADSFPRISLFTVGGSGNKIGGYKADIDSRPTIQIDIWTRNGVPFTISGRKYANEYLGRYLGNKVLNTFDDFEEQLFGIFFDFDVVGFPRGVPYSEEYQSHHTMVEIRVKGLNLGRIVK
jgi:hypothetical protein